MRHPFQSEPSQVGPQGGLPGTGVPLVAQSVDTATLELLSIWQQEDATTDPVQLRAAEEELAAFRNAVNGARTASGEPLVYP
jgi:hypothetical protein